MKYICIKNGYNIHSDLCSHYKNISYLANKATEYKQKLKTLEYRGYRTIFKIEEYYKRLTEAFTDLEYDGPSHYLNEHKMDLKFENGLQNNDTTRYHIKAKNEWYALPVPKQTFDKFYNLFSANFSKFKSMIEEKSGDYSKNKKLFIKAAGTGRGGRGRFVSCDVFGGSGDRGRGGRGCGQVWGSTYNPYHPPSANRNIKIESCQYPKE